MSNNDGKITLEVVSDTTSANAGVKNLTEVMIKLNGELEQMRTWTQAIIAETNAYTQAAGGEVTIINKVSEALYNNGTMAKEALKVRTDGITDLKNFTNALSDALARIEGFKSFADLHSSFIRVNKDLETQTKTLNNLHLEALAYKEALANIKNAEQSGGVAKPQDYVTRDDFNSAANNAAYDAALVKQKQLKAQLDQLETLIQNINKVSTTDQADQQLRRLTANIGASKQAIVEQSQAVVANKDEIAKRTRAVEEAVQKEAESGNRLLSIEKQRSLELSQIYQARENSLNKSTSAFLEGSKYGNNKLSYFSDQARIYRNADWEIRGINAKYDAIKTEETKRLKELEQLNQNSQDAILAYKRQSSQAQVLAERQLQAQLIEASTGSNSVKTLRAQIAVQEEQLAQTHANNMLAIETRLRASLANAQNPMQISSALATANSERTAELHRNEQEVVAQLSGSYQTLANRINETSYRTMSMWERIGSLIGIYRVWNAVINTTIQTLKDIPTAGIEKQATLSTLQASLTPTVGNSGSASELGLSRSQQAMSFLREEANRTGISLLTLEKNYRTFLSSVTLAGESVNTATKLFKNANTVITALHMSGDRAELTFMALSQMFNKGKIQSEELVKQLGNLLPGAFAAFAAATGRTTETLVSEMKRGAVAAHGNVDAFLQYYADRFKSAFDTASQGYNALLGRSETAYTEFTRSIFTISEPLLELYQNLKIGLLNAFTLSDTTISTLQTQFNRIYDSSLLKTIVDLEKRGLNLLYSTTGTAPIVANSLKANLTEKNVNELSSGALQYSPGDLHLYNAEQKARIIAIDREIISKAITQSLEFEKAVATNSIALENQQRITARLQETFKSVSALYSMYLKNATDGAKLNEIQNLFSEPYQKAADTIRQELYPLVVKYEEKVTNLKSLHTSQLTAKQNNPSLDILPNGFFPEGSLKGLTESQNDAILSRYNTELLDGVLKQENKVNEELDKQQQKRQEAASWAKDQLSLSKDELKFQEAKAGLLYKNTETVREEIFQLEKRKQLLLETLAAQEGYTSSVQVSSKVSKEVTASYTNPKNQEIIQLIKSKALQAGVDPYTALAQAYAESRFNPKAIGPTNDKGLFQFIPSTGRSMGLVGQGFDNRFDANASTDAYIRLTKANLEQADGNIEKSLSLYNTGTLTKGKAYTQSVLETRAAIIELDKTASPIAQKQLKLTEDQIEAYKKEISFLDKSKAIRVDYLKTISKIPEKSEIDKLNEFLSPSKKDYKNDYASGTLSEQYLKSSKELLEVEKELYSIAQSLDSSKAEQTRLEKMQALSSETGATSEQLQKQNVLVTEQERTLENLKTQYSAIKDVVTSTEKGLRTRFDDEAKSAEDYLNKQIRRANASDKTLYLDDVRERLIKANAVGTIYEKTSKEIEGQLAKINKKYGELQETLANKRLFDTLKSGFSSMLSDWVNGTKSFGESFKSILQNAVNVVLENATQKFTTALEDIISSGGKAGWGSLLGSVAQIGIAAATTLFRKTPGENQTPVASVLSNQRNNYLGSASFFTSDTLSRNTSTLITTETIRSFNSSLEAVQSLATKYSDAIYAIGDKLVAKVSGTSLGAFLKPIGTFFDSISAYINKAVDWGIGLVSKGIDVAASAVGGTSSAIGSKAGSAAGSAIGETASAAISAVGAIYAIVKLGFSLAEIANNKYLNTIEKVEAGLKEATLASLAIPVVGWAVAAVLHSANTTLQITDAMNRGDAYDMANGVAFGFAGDLGVMTQEMMFGREIPSTTMLSYPDQRNFTYQKDSQNKDFFTTKGPKSSGVGVDTAFGQLEMRYNDIKRISWEQAKESYQSLLENIKLYDQTLADGISKVDASYKGKNTIQEFLKVSKQFETEHDLESLNSAGMVFERLTKYIAGGLTATGTKAGITAGNWITAFADKITNSKSPDLNQVFNIEAAIGKYLPELAAMPEHLATLFVKNVKGISEGATQAQFEQEFKDFWQGWFTASTGLQNLGTDIGLTQIEEWLASLVDLNFQVKDAGTNLVAYATALKGAGTYTNETLGKLFSDLKATASANGFDTAKTSQFISTNILVGKQGTDIRSISSASSINNLSLEMFKAAKAATEQANAQIDVLITQEKLNSLTREQAIEQLRLAGKIDDSTIATANFSSALLDQQKKFLENTTLINNISILYSETLSNIGVSLESAANSGASLVSALGSAGDAMNLFQQTLENFSSPEYASQANVNLNKAAFDAAAKTAGLIGYSLEQFAKDVATPQIAGAYFALQGKEGKSADQIAADSQKFSALTALLQAGNAYKEATVSNLEIQKQAEQSHAATLANIDGNIVSSSQDVVSAFGSLDSAIKSTRANILSTLPKAVSETKNPQYAQEAINAIFKNPGIANFFGSKGVTAQNAVSSYNSFFGGLNYAQSGEVSKWILDNTANNPELKQNWEDLQTAIGAINSYNDSLQANADATTTAANSAEEAKNTLLEVNKQLSLLGKSDIRKSIQSIENDIADLYLKIPNSIEVGLLKVGKYKELVQPFVDEVLSFGKSDVQKSLDSISKWTTEMTEAAPTLASGLNMSTKEVQTWIDTISSQRTLTALQGANKELTGFQTTIVDWVTKLKQTTLGTPLEQFQNVQNDAFSTYQKALSYDKTALGNITSKADSYIQKITEMYGNSDYAQMLIGQVADAMSALPTQMNLSDYIQQGSLDIVNELKVLPQNLLKTGITFTAPTIGIDLPLTSLTTSTSKMTIATDNSEVVLALATLNDNMKIVQKQLDTIQKNAIQAVNDSIDAETAIAYNSTKSVVEAISKVIPTIAVELK